MRRLMTFVLLSTTAVAALAQQSSHTPVNKAQVDRWITELSNWGRWGKDDQLGALNYITPAKRREAMALAKDGIVVSLEQPIKVVPKPAETKADGKPHGVAFYEIRFKTFPADDPRGNPGALPEGQDDMPLPRNRHGHAEPGEGVVGGASRGRHGQQGQQGSAGRQAAQAGTCPGRACRCGPP